MTILLTSVCLEPEFTGVEAGASGPLDQRATELQRAALFAVIVGSNVGALFTLVGALAGIM